MKFVGVIAEYHPFHNGHAAQLEILREKGAEIIAVAMSPQVVQRGELALLPTEARVRAALQGGADLVVALPAPYACATAQQFAAAGVSLLTALGADTLAFGAEGGTAGEFMELAKLLQEDALSQPLRREMKKGLTFAAARAQALEEIAPHLSFLLNSPNNILGVEYCRAILEQNSPLEPLPLPRLGTDHDSPVPVPPYASASWLRKIFREKGLSSWEPFVPTYALEEYRKSWERGEFLSRDRAQVAILSRLRAMSGMELSRIRQTGEGLERRLERCIQESASLEELYTTLKTKRYPLARLRRLVLDSALDYREDLPSLPPYLHVLGSRRSALPLLKGATLPAKTSLAQLAQTGSAAREVAMAHSRAEDLAALCWEKPQRMGLAYTRPPVLL